MIPLRASALKYSGKWPSNIIIHHTAEFVPDVPNFKFDTSKPQSNAYIDYSFKVLHKTETKYHYILEKIGNDYQIVISQPMFTKCRYEDLDSKYDDSIHVACMGNYNLDIPPTRLYKVLSYRLLAPLMRLFYLKTNDILLHRAISNEDIICPGEFFEMDRLINQLTSVRKVKSLRRGK